MVASLLAIILMAALPTAAGATSDAEVRAAVNRHLQLPADGVGGAAVAVRIEGRTLMFNLGNAAPGRPITARSLFNLASVGKAFIATLLAQAVKQGEMTLDDPVAKHIGELAQGGDIRRVTLRQLASHTSGLTRTPQESAHRGPYALADFLRYLVAWQADEGHQPGRQFIYSNSGFALLQLALQRRFQIPSAQLMNERLLRRLGMSSTALPVPTASTRGEIAPALRVRAVQGYGPGGRAIGKPGDEQGGFDWPGSGQMYSSAQDMAQFLAANLGELADRRPLQEAMALAQQGVFAVSPQFTQALAWQVVTRGDLTLIDKNGGLDDTSTYIGFIPQQHLGVVLLMNRGGQGATRIGRQIMLTLASSNAEPGEDGATGD